MSSLAFHPRPFMDGLARNYLSHAADSSFPSDHSTLLFAIGWSLALVPPTAVRRAWLIPVALALLVGWARVFLGAHYPFDVAGACFVAMASAAVVASPWRKTCVQGLERIIARYLWRPPGPPRNDGVSPACETWP